MKLQEVKLIGLLIFILLINTLTGHFLAPLGVLIIPIIMSSITGLIFFTKNNLSILLKSFLSYLFIGLNDIGIKLFAGGIHDMEGIGWINMLLCVGFVPCFILLGIGIFRDKNSVTLIKILSILIFILMAYIHLEIFETLGVPLN